MVYAALREIKQNEVDGCRNVNRQNNWDSR